MRERRGEKRGEKKKHSNKIELRGGMMAHR